MSEGPEKSTMENPASNKHFPTAEDLPIDVCISYPEGTSRIKQFLHSSKTLVETLVQWKAQGYQDILLTWGTTTEEVREKVEHQIMAVGVAYRVPESSQPKTNPSNRRQLLLSGVTALAILGLLGFGVTRILFNLGQGIEKVGKEERDREEQNRRNIARSLEGIKKRTFREMEDPDPKTRLESTLLVGQVYWFDEEAVPALIKRLKDSDQRVRLAAIVMLGKIKPESEKATKALRDCLKDENANIRQAAQETLEKLN
jgi:hypothetical protein